MQRLLAQLKEIKRYPSAIVGLIIIMILVIAAIAIVIAIPYEEAVLLWRGGEVWQETPRRARPVYMDWFTGDDIPRTDIIDTRDHPEYKSEETMNGTKQFTIEIPYDYQYDGFPKEFSIFFDAEYEETRPHVNVEWETPDGRIFETDAFSVREDYNFRLSNAQALRRAFDVAPRVGMFMDPEVEEPAPLKGEYTVRITGHLFEEDADIEARMVSYGQVHGWFGTDHRRRELSIGLLWGLPIALVFGAAIAVGANVSTLFVAAMFTWFRGWLDWIGQRITQVNLCISNLVLLIMVGMLYTRSLWVMGAILVIKGVFSAYYFTYRSMFLSIKEEPYVEAGLSYGTGNFRMIFFYMVPKVVPFLIPQLITAIPTYVFLEATLAMLGLGDPVLPTLGKVLNDAHGQGAIYMGQYYWVLQPAALLMVIGISFALTGYALDRIMNPRLREE